MTKPDNFILNSDYATLKNDAISSISLTLPSSTTVGARSVRIFSTDLEIGVAESSLRVRMMTTKDNIWRPLSTVSYVYPTGSSISGDPSYLLYLCVNRVSPTTIRLSAFIPNQYPSTATITGLSQTITAYVATFLPPTP